MPDSPCVKLWRDTFLLNLSASWKADVDKTITDLALWRSILDGWYYIKAGKKIRKAPGIKNLLTEYERRSYERLEAASKDVKEHHGEEPVSDSDRPWVSKRSVGNVSEVPSNPERIYFRAS